MGQIENKLKNSMLNPITFNVHGLTILFNDWIIKIDLKKGTPNSGLSIRNKHVKLQIIWDSCLEKAYHINTNQEKYKMAKIISDKINFREKSIMKDKKYFVYESNYPEVKTFLSVMT